MQNGAFLSIVEGMVFRFFSDFDLRQCRGLKEVFLSGISNFAFWFLLFCWYSTLKPVWRHNLWRTCMVIRVIPV